MRETRETAAMRAHTAHNADLPELTLWCDLEEEEREIWRRVADAVLATLQWEYDAAITGRLDDLEERLRRLEKQS